MSEKKLLVVDDDPNVVTFVEAALRDRGYRVAGAGSAEEALDRVEEVAPDACLLDVRLPGMNGLEALRALRRAGVRVPIVVITSHASMSVAIDAMKEGAYDFVTKPLKADSLARILDQVDSAATGAAEDIDYTAAGDEDAEVCIVGKSAAMIEVYKTIGRVAETNATVLITGESGSGKELVARVIHQNSLRREGPFLALNCAAIPEQLLESELFGHEKGAFTGSVQRTIGKFEQAHRGTLFLDEIGDMPLALQGKILRALQEREIERVGGTARIPVDVRVLAATNRDLAAAVEAGTFREELYYRLAVVTIALPALRERSDDIRRLTDYFVQRFATQLDRKVERVSSEVYKKLEAYDWPGNVRELRNVLARALILGRGPTLVVGELPELAPAPLAERARVEPMKELCRQRLSLPELEHHYISALLDELDWNFSRAAEALHIHRNTLRRKLEEYGIRKPA